MTDLYLSFTCRLEMFCLLAEKMAQTQALCFTILGVHSTHITIINIRAVNRLKYLNIIIPIIVHS